MSKTFLSLLFFVLFFTPSPAHARNTLVSVTFEDTPRSYEVHLPSSGTPPEEGWPLVLVFHGALGNSSEIRRQSGMDQKADEENFIAVYPNGTTNDDGKSYTWNGGNCCGYADAVGTNDVGYIGALIDRLKSDYPVDPRRVYVTGFSNGALLAYRLACRLSKVIAAAAPVSGALNDADCNPKESVSVIVFHGTYDGKVLYNGGISEEIYGSKYDNPVSFAIDFWVRRNQCDPQPQIERYGDIIHKVYTGGEKGTEVELYTLAGGGHEWPTAETGLSATDIIWDFFKKHPKI